MSFNKRAKSLSKKSFTRKKNKQEGQATIYLTADSEYLKPTKSVKSLTSRSTRITSPVDLNRNRSDDQKESRSERKSKTKDRTKSRSKKKERKEYEEHKEQNEQNKDSSRTLSPIVRVYFPQEQSKFTNYKSIRATSTSTTTEVLTQALIKYRIPEEEYCTYELFDVVGTIVKLTAQIDDPTGLIPQEQFMELYSRNMNELERPMFIQDLWQAKEGYERRFELRQNAQIKQRLDQDKLSGNTNSSSGNNLPISSMNLKDASLASMASNDYGTRSLIENHPSHNISNMRVASVSASNIGQQMPGHTHHDSRMGTVSALRSTSHESINEDTPYLHTIHGSRIQKLLLKFKSDVIIGSSHSSDFVLANDPDIEANHCSIGFYIGQDEPSMTNYDPALSSSYSPQTKSKFAKSFDIQIKKISREAYICINNFCLTSKQYSASLNHGDVVALGSQYLGILIVPNMNKHLSNKQLNEKMALALSQFHRNGSNNILDQYQTGQVGLGSQFNLNNMGMDESGIMSKGDLNRVLSNSSSIYGTPMAQNIQHVQQNTKRQAPQAPIDSSSVSSPQAPQSEFNDRSEDNDFLEKHSEDYNPPLAVSDFEQDYSQSAEGQELKSISKRKNVVNLSGSLVPDVAVPPPGSAGEKQMLDFIFKG